MIYFNSFDFNYFLDSYFILPDVIFNILNSSGEGAVSVLLGLRRLLFAGRGRSLISQPGQVNLIS